MKKQWYSSFLTFKIAAILLFICTRCISAANLIGVSNNEPLAKCNIGSTISFTEISQAIKNASVNSRDSLDFQGIQVELVLKIGRELKWNFDDYSLVCKDQVQVQTGVDSGEFLFGMGGISINQQYMQKNFVFSYPIFYGGLKIAVLKQQRTTMWSFFDPFGTDLWVTLLISAFWVGLVTLGFEEPLTSRKNQCMQYLINFREMLYQSFSSFFFASDMRIQRFSTRIVFVSFWFIVIIFTSTYVANLTVLISPSRFDQRTFYDIDSIFSSSNIQIYSYSDYTTDTLLGFSLLDKQSFKTGSFGFFDRTAAPLSYVLQEFYAESNSAVPRALILESGLIQIASSLHPCSTYVLNGRISIFNYGFFFQDTQNALLAKINKEIVDMKETNEYNYIVQKYVQPVAEEYQCQKLDPEMKLENITGLWVFLIVITIICIVAQLIYEFRKSRDQSRQFREKLRQAESLDEPNYLVYQDDDEDLGFLMVSDYVHQPSANIHVSVKADVKERVDKVEILLRDRFQNSELKILDKIQKYPKLQQFYLQEKQGGGSDQMQNQQDDEGEEQQQPYYKQNPNGTINQAKLM